MTDISSFQTQLPVGSRVRVKETGVEGWILSTSFAWCGENMDVPSVSYVLAGEEVDGEVEEDDEEMEHALEYYAEELELLDAVSEVTVEGIVEYLDSLDTEEEEGEEEEPSGDDEGDL